MDSPKKSPQNSPNIDATIKVHFPNGGFNVIKYSNTVNIKGIITTVTERLATGPREFNSSYAVRLSRASSSQVRWLSFFFFSVWLAEIGCD